jgi:UDP-N-acetylmuramoyl-L-alanyl-D-glutamate--2,6-diaminopimelate ligase
MTLREVIGDAARDAPPVEVRARAYDNRAVVPGTVFFCVRGLTRDGHDFASDAVARGASALVVDHPLGLGVPEVVVDDVRAAMAPAAARLHGDPTATLRMTGITGTNGKTTTAHLVRAILEHAGRPTGMLGTVTQVVGGAQTEAVRTTPEGIDLQRLFAAMREAGDTDCVMEVSSHAVALHRTDAIHWAVAVFTNLTQDHLDFHPDMEDYFAAKRALFLPDAGTGAVAPAASVVCVEDPYGARLASDLRQAGRHVVTVGIDAPGADLQASGVASTFTATTFTADDRTWTIPLPGRFNVLNALAAIAAARLLGAGDDVVEEALRTAARVPGRFEPVDEGQSFGVLVDYAHTPDALENVLAAARPLSDGRRVVCVFGCGGDRDRAKRPLMGEIAARLADVVVVTSDNPRSEDPDAILAEILTGVPDRDAVEVIEDRRAAIARAVGLARPGDVVVVAGKGHEQGQELAGGRKVPFDDVTVVREALRALPGAPDLGSGGSR